MPHFKALYRTNSLRDTYSTNDKIVWRYRLFINEFNERFLLQTSKYL